MKKALAMLLAAGFTLLCLAGCSTPTSDLPAGEGDSLGAASASGGSSGSANGDLIPITVAVPRTIEVLEDGPLWMAKHLGYWEELGLDVTLEQSFGTTDLKMVATGNADFCFPGPNLILAGIEEGLPIKVMMGYDTINIWGMCVPEDSPVQSWEDMVDASEKYGKRLTVALGDAAWEMLVSPTMVAAGIDLEKDIEFVVAGENRYIQVDEGNIDMLFTWPGEAWQLVGQGFKFNYIDGDDVLKTCSNSFVANVDMIENNPEVVQAFATGLMKGMYATWYAPEVAAAVILTQFPSMGVDWNTAIYVQQGRSYQNFGKPGSEDEKTFVDSCGKLWPEKWETTVEAAVGGGIIKEPIPLDQIYTDQFYDDSWDKAEVEADCDAYDWESVKEKYESA